MLDVLFWILFSLMLLIVVPDLRHARREIAKRQAEKRARGALIRRSGNV
jgi:hypothetical protein